MVRGLKNKKNKKTTTSVHTAFISSLFLCWQSCHWVGGAQVSGHSYLCPHLLCRQSHALSSHLCSTKGELLYIAKNFFIRQNPWCFFFFSLLLFFLFISFHSLSFFLFSFSPLSVVATPSSSGILKH